VGGFSNFAAFDHRAAGRYRTELAVAHERDFIGGVAILQRFVPVVEAAKADNRRALEKRRFPSLDKN
jgi:hypothetical protein